MSEALPTDHFLFASESFTEGSPDKLCDRVSDAVLDECLKQDKDARVSCETCTKTGMVMILGEIVTKATVNYEQVVREVVKSTGYDSDDKGLDWRTMNVIVAIEDQNPDLAQAITANKDSEDTSAGNHGVAFGYATSESPEKMPLSHMLATKLCIQLDKSRKSGTVGWLHPNGKAQVTIEYREEADGAVVPVRIHSITICAQRVADVSAEQIEKDLMEHVVKPTLPEQLCDSKTVYHLTQAKLLLPGTNRDTGLTGKKIVADTYGGWVSHACDSISGKDASKISRSATYGARFAARCLVESGLCKRCVVQLIFSPSDTEPVRASVYSYGSAKACGKTDAELANILLQNFDFRPSCLQRDFSLKKPQFLKLAAYGHFGRADLDLEWEKPKQLKFAQAC